MAQVSSRGLTLASYFGQNALSKRPILYAATHSLFSCWHLSKYQPSPTWSWNIEWTAFVLQTKAFLKILVFLKFSRPCYPSRSFFGATDPYKSTLCQTSPYESWQPTRKQLCSAQRVNFKEGAKDLFSPSRMLSGSSVLFRQWSVVLFWYPGGH